MKTLEELGIRAKQAAAELALKGAVKTTALQAAADALWQRHEEILAGNRIDLEQAEENGIAPAMLDRASRTRLAGCWTAMFIPTD